MIHAAQAVNPRGPRPGQTQSDAVLALALGFPLAQLAQACRVMAVRVELAVSAENILRRAEYGPEAADAIASTGGT